MNPCSIIPQLLEAKRDAESKARMFALAASAASESSAASCQNAHLEAAKMAEARSLADAVESILTAQESEFMEIQSQYVQGLICTAEYITALALFYERCIA